MATFKHPFVDFSQGEISEKLLVLATSTETKRGATYVENMRTTKTKGISRRTGTIQMSDLLYPVYSENQDVKLFSFFLDEDRSFLGAMYVVKIGELTAQEKIDINIPGLEAYNNNLLVLYFEFFQFDGDVLTRVNDFGLALDVNFKDTYLKDFFPNTFANTWLDVSGFRFAKYKNFMVFVHDGQDMEPFCISYNGTEFEFFLYRDGLSVTSEGAYPTKDIAAPFNLPFNQSNLNPDIALEVERIVGSDQASFFITARYYDANTGDYVDWSDYTPPLSSSINRSHPFTGFMKYVRLTIGGNQYVLEYNTTIPTGGTIGDAIFIDDLSDTDDVNYGDKHFFTLVLGSDSAKLYDVLSSSPVTTTDFQFESYNRIDRYPDNVVFHQQRLVFSRDGKLFNSVVGNAFFMHQYRFAQDTIVGIKFVEVNTGGGSTTEKEARYPLLVPYTGTKVRSDAFDFIPYSNLFAKRSWLSSADTLEFGTFSEVLNIGTTEDGVYGYDTVKPSTGTSEGSKQSISERVNNFTLFVGGNNFSLRDYYFNGRERRYVSNDLNQLNPEIVKHLEAKFSTSIADDEFFIKNFSVDLDNDTIFCVVGPNNVLISIRYSLVDRIQSWHRETLGGYDIQDGYIPVYSTIFLRSNKSKGSLFLVTKHGSKFYIERFSKDYGKKEFNARKAFGNSVKISDLPVYLDSSNRQVSATKKRAWTLPSFYYNKTVDVLADGFYIKDVSVDSSGVINLDRDVYTLVAGFRYKSTLDTMAIEPNRTGEAGSSLDTLKTINRVSLRLYNSFGGYISTLGGTYSSKLPYDQDNMLVGTTFELFTGSIRIPVELVSSEDMRVRVEGKVPYPFELISLVVKGEVNDG